MYELNGQMSYGSTNVPPFWTRVQHRHC